VEARRGRPPMKQGYGHTLWAEAARELGYKPFPQPRFSQMSAQDVIPRPA
jgi:hypothetical protein